ncbi:MAG: ABC transporter permease [Candidatus Rokubacteria bacterium]|nr:ABC transporter permease [Candidatus Rokubacteria bacterium]
MACWHRWVRGVGAVLLPLAIWELVSRTVLNAVLIPPPTVVSLAAWEMLQSGELFVHIMVSLRRIFVGFALGSTVGIAIGVLAAWNRLVWDLVRPLVAVCSAVPPVALIPLAMTWFGIDETARLFLITYLAAVLMLPNAMSGVRNIAPIRIRAARSLGARSKQIYLSVMLPDAFPFILTGLRVTLGFCFMVVVAAEMIGANSGVGYVIMQSRHYAMTTKMFVGILLLGLMGIAFDALFRRLLATSLPRFAVEKRTS